MRCEQRCTAAIRTLASLIPPLFWGAAGEKCHNFEPGPLRLMCGESGGEVYSGSAHTNSRGVSLLFPININSGGCISCTHLSFKKVRRNKRLMPNLF